MLIAFFNHLIKCVVLQDQQITMSGKSYGQRYLERWILIHSDASIPFSTQATKKKWMGKKKPNISQFQARFSISELKWANCSLWRRKSAQTYIILAISEILIVILAIIFVNIIGSISYWKLQTQNLMQQP